MTKQIAFLFPGQGSQAVGMGTDIYAASDVARHVFRTFDEALGFALSELCFHGPEEVLRSTINAQPAIVAVSLAYLAAFQAAVAEQASREKPSQAEPLLWAWPIMPTAVAGHSVGEAASLVPAGAADLSTVARFVRERGRLMHEAEIACPGGMAAIIGMDEQILQEICQQATQQTEAGEVVIANYNAPGQIVISGEQKALEKAMASAQAQGAARVILLPVSGAFHSPVMAPAVEQLVNFLTDMPIRDARIPIISNITGMPLTETAAIRHELGRQIAASVQWTRTIQHLTSVGVTTFFEIGPGRALAGMIKRIARSATIINIGSVADIEKAVAFVRDHGII
jgi:[acyl-carrier-protein] S-malonyltransferase